MPPERACFSPCDTPNLEYCSAETLSLIPANYNRIPWRPAACAGGKKVQVRGIVRGSATVLGDAASDIELFLTDDLLTR